MGSDANLYLLNPAGILFGTNTQLNLLGSFTAATASHLEFGQNWLTVLGTNDYQALVGEPTGLAFHASSPAPVINTGTLELQSGQTLRLLGGSIINTGSLVNPDGVIDVVAVPGDSTIRITLDGFLLGLDLRQVISDNADSADLLNTLTFTDLPSLLTGGDNDHAVQLLVAEDGSITVQSTEDSSGHLNNLDDQELALVSGSLDVSGEYGGSISILGNNIQLIDSELNANGLQGAGKIRIGGDYRGRRTVPIAERLGVDSNTYINADAINFGSGGSVILWANNQTDFFGTISATGGETSGDGGFSEISRRGSIAINGVVDLSAINGQIGTLLLDPENILIRGDIDPGDADGQLPEILLDEFLNETVTLSQEALENIAETADIVLEATNDIQIGELENNELNLGNDTERIGSISFIADADQDGQGAFIADTDATISTNTRDINISGATITVGSIRTGLQQSGPGGDIDLSAIGDISTGLLGTGEGNVGDIRVVSQQGDITVDSFISTSSGPGDGGSIDVESGGNIFLRENIASLSRERGAGGPIALTGTGANSQIEILGNITFGSSDVISSGALTINTLGDVILEGELINLGGADIAIGNNVSPQTLLLSENISSNGNNVFLRATESLTTVDIDTSSNTIGGVIDISSTLGDVNLGNITTNGIESGGAVSLFSGGDLNVEFINTSATPGDGGDVELGATEDIEVAAVNAQGGINGGGITINIDTDQFFRATDTFTDQNGIDASISAVGGAGNGFINIEHGGQGVTPFIIGDASVNGTAGTITASVENTLAPVQSILESLITENINITTDIPEVEIEEPVVESEELMTENLLLEEIQPENEAVQIEDNSLTEPVVRSQDILRQIELLSEVKPVIIHLDFVEDTKELLISLETSNAFLIKEPIPIQDNHDFLGLVKTFYDRASSVSIGLQPGVISNKDSDAKAISSYLYDYIISPIEADLERIKATPSPTLINIESWQNPEINLVFSVADSQLGNIPFAALWNKHQQYYLVEKYSVGLKPINARPDYQRLNINNMNMAVMINSDQLEYGSEFTDMVRTIFSPWQVKDPPLNQDTICQLEQGNFQIVHIGSHAELNVGVSSSQKSSSEHRLQSLRNISLGTEDPEQPIDCQKKLENDSLRQGNQSMSYISLSKNERLTFRAFNELDLSAVELLVLHACATAKEMIGIDGGAELGFAGLANNLGVKSVMGTLWEIDEGQPSIEEINGVEEVNIDASSGTFKLMSLFYENLHREGMIKAEALRQAQLTFIKDMRESQEVQDYDHPYYWAGFTIVGSPW